MLMFLFYKNVYPFFLHEDIIGILNTVLNQQPLKRREAPKKHT